MEKKLDLRIQKTYLAITQAFVDMLEEMRFEDIRISNLCERAMVRKSTFYKHFGDKNELLAFVVRQAQEKFNTQLSEERENMERAAYYTQLIALVLDFLGQNKALVQSTIRSNSFPLIESILIEQIMLDIRRQLREDARRGEKLPASPEVMAAFFVGGVMGTVRYWLKKDRAIDDPVLKEQLSSLLEQFYNVLKENA